MIIANEQSNSASSISGEENIMAINTSTARSNILAKLNRQVAGADYKKLPTETPFEYPELSFEQQLAQFITHLENNHAQVIKLSKQDIAKTVETELAKRNVSRLLYGKNSPYNEEVEAIASNVLLTPFDFSLAANVPKTKEKLFNEMPAAISSSHSAIAQTGSIVLWPTQDEPRTLSLVPPIHFVIVDSNELYQNFATLIKAQNWRDKLPTNVVLVSGPSKTADIQQTLAYGAHGPKELIVLLLESENVNEGEREGGGQHGN